MHFGFTHSFILNIYIAPLQVHYCSEALPTPAWSTRKVLRQRLEYVGKRSRYNVGGAPWMFVSHYFRKLKKAGDEVCGFSYGNCF